MLKVALSLAAFVSFVSSANAQPQLEQLSMAIQEERAFCYGGTEYAPISTPAVFNGCMTTFFAINKRCSAGTYAGHRYIDQDCAVAIAAQTIKAYSPPPPPVFIAPYAPPVQSNDTALAAAIVSNAIVSSAIINAQSQWPALPPSIMPSLTIPQPQFVFIR